MPREMKDSGVEWIGEIPTTWTTDRLQWHLEEVKVSNSPIQSEQILSLTIEAGVIPYEEKGNQGNKSKENYEEYKLAYPNTLVVNSMNVIIGAVGISKYFGCVSPVYYVFRATPNTDLRYIYYLFTNVGFQKEMRKYAKGILEIRLRISAEDMLKRIIPKPSYKEQKAIADFLDRRCAEIDAVIEQTKATIEEYKKLKQSVITEAVTKGTRCDRPMKDSGIEWIGEIPREWDVVRKLSYRCMSSISYGIVKLLEPDDENGVKVLRCSDVYEGGISLDNVRTVSQEVSNEYRRTLLTGGEIIIAVRGSLGGCAVVPTELSGYNVAREIAVIPLDASLTNNKYAMYYLLSDAFIKYRDSHLLGSVYVGLNIELLSACPLIEPSLKEQKEIADYLDQKCAEIDTLIEKKTALLAEMETYKKSLIFEYVTGKKEVC